MKHIVAVILLLFMYYSSNGQDDKQSYTLDSVVVAAKERRSLKSTQISATNMPVATICSMPATLGEIDILKSLQMIPGVQSGGDGNVSLHIRGGSSSQNLFLIDGMPLYNPEHFKGYVSAINPANIEDVILYKGGFPAQYGNRLSGIVDVTTKRGDINAYHGQLNIGLFSISAFAGGPILKNKLSFSISARKSYFKEITTPFVDWLYDDADKSDYGDNYNFPFNDISFYDINTKLTYTPNKCNIIDINLYKGKDKTQLNELEQSSIITNEDNTQSYETKYTDSSNEDWGNMLAGINWKYTNDNITINTQYSWSSYTYNEWFKTGVQESCFKEPDSILMEWSKTSKYSEYKSEIKKHLLSSITKINDGIFKNLELGVELGYGEYKPSYIVRNTNEHSSGIINEESSLIDDDRCMISGGIFASYGFRIGNIAEMDLGIRGAYHLVNDKSYIYPEPRINMLLNITDNMQFKAAYSLISQSEHRVTTSDLVEDSDMWFPSTKDIEPAISSQIAAGLFYDFKNTKGWSISIEGYYKDMKNILEYKAGTIAATNASKWEESISRGKGWAYGAEVLIQKNSGNTTGWLSYSWSRSLLKFNREGEVLNNGLSFYAPYDCRNSITFNLQQKLAKNLNLVASFSYNTGRFRTVDNLTFRHAYKDADNLVQSYDGNGIQLLYQYWTYKQVKASERNNVRLEDIHKLDISMNYSIYHNKMNGVSKIMLGVTNIYNHYNTSFIRASMPLVKVCLFPIMPLLAYSYDF